MPRRGPARRPADSWKCIGAEVEVARQRGAVMAYANVTRSERQVTLAIRGREFARSSRSSVLSFGGTALDAACRQGSPSRAFGADLEAVLSCEPAPRRHGAATTRRRAADFPVGRHGGRQEDAIPQINGLEWPRPESHVHGVAGVAPRTGARHWRRLLRCPRHDPTCRKPSRDRPGGE